MKNCHSGATTDVFPRSAGFRGSGDGELRSWGHLKRCGSPALQQPADAPMRWAGAKARNRRRLSFGLDVGQHAGDHLFGCQVGGIDAQGIVGGLQGGHAAGGVIAITLHHL